MVDNSSTYAVIMGDIVRSERSVDLASMHRRFNAAVETQNGVFADRLASPLTITLGDEFQGLARSLSDAVPLMRRLRLQLLADDIDCRFVVGMVELKTPLNREKAWNMMGPGLARARHLLNEKRTASLYRFSLTRDPLLETMLDALGAGLTSIERRWTKRQLADIAVLLEGVSPGELARHRNVSVHSVYKVRGSGYFDAYLMQWDAVAAALAAVDEREGMA